MASIQALPGTGHNSGRGRRIRRAIFPRHDLHWLGVAEARAAEARFFRRHLKERRRRRQRMHAADVHALPINSTRMASHSDNCAALVMA